jgi:hypothetical protein
MSNHPSCSGSRHDTCIVLTLTSRRADSAAHLAVPHVVVGLEFELRLVVVPGRRADRERRVHSDVVSDSALLLAVLFSTGPHARSQHSSLCLAPPLSAVGLQSLGGAAALSKGSVHMHALIFQLRRDVYIVWCGATSGVLDGHGLQRAW